MLIQELPLCAMTAALALGQNRLNLLKHLECQFWALQMLSDQTFQFGQKLWAPNKKVWNPNQSTTVSWSVLCKETQSFRNFKRLSMPDLLRKKSRQPRLHSFESMAWTCAISLTLGLFFSLQSLERRRWRRDRPLWAFSCCGSHSVSESELPLNSVTGAIRGSMTFRHNVLKCIPTNCVYFRWGPLPKNSWFCFPFSWSWKTKILILPIPHQKVKTGWEILRKSPSNWFKPVHIWS